jgi:protein SCO1/2
MSETEIDPNGSSQAIPWRRVLPPLLVLLVLVAGLSVLLLSPKAHSTLPGGAHEVKSSTSGYDGTLALPARKAPPIHLRNYMGQEVSLSQYRGKAVLVTFLYTNCPDICPLITSNLRVALNLLGKRAADTQVIAVSVDPRGDTPKAVAHFLAEHGMTGRMQYLIGSAAELSRTWEAWGVGAKPEVGQPNLVAHSALVYGIGASGRVRTIYPDSFRPQEIAHDVVKLASS